MGLGDILAEYGNLIELLGVDDPATSSAAVSPHFIVGLPSNIRLIWSRDKKNANADWKVYAHLYTRQVPKCELHVHPINARDFAYEWPPRNEWPPIN